MNGVVATNSKKCAFEEAMDRLSREVLEGLQHGFFEFELSGEIISGRKRRLTIKAGKSHQFTIPEEELNR